MMQFAGKLAPFLARAWPTAQKVGNFMVPGGAPTPGALGGNLALSLIPNALFAGLSGASLPEGTGFMDRGLVAGEQFLGSVGAEFGAQALAGAGLHLAGNRIGPGGQMLARSAVAMTVPTVAWASGALQQPNAQRIWGEYQARMEQEAMAENSKREQEIWEEARQQAFAEMGGFGPARQAYQGMYGGTG